MRKMLVVAFCCLCLSSAPFVNGQVPDLKSRTLDFRNVTSTNVNQTVAENPGGNEKDISFSDYDNDGDMDVVISMARSEFDQRSNKLYRNDNGVLQEVSGTSVIPGFAFPDVARSAFFKDYDLDGFSDIIIVCDSNSGTTNNNSPGKTKYFRNVDGISFVNESERLDGITGSADNGVSADFDSNGYPDLIMANTPNISQDSYVLNNINGSGGGQFSLVTNTHFPVESDYGSNAEAADMNADGQIDCLIANFSVHPSFIYYNNNEGLGSGTGDFRYGGLGDNSSFPEIGGLDERVLFPGDFNNDGRTDFYFSNRIRDGNDLLDFVMQNVGNDELNRAEFSPIAMPASTNSETMKVRSADLDEDGRMDLLVMSEFRRPQVFRNTSENGDISFVEWTPPVFTVQHAGWQANSTDILGDSRCDILVGALIDDHLFENTDSDLFDASKLAGKQLPPLHAAQPIAITGEVEIGQTLTLSTDELPQGANVSVLVRSLGDASLVVRQDGAQIESSNRLGHGSDEAIQFEVPGSGTVTFEIGIDALSFDGNGDGIVNLLDVSSFVDCLNGSSIECDPFDLNDDGQLSLLFVQPFVDSVTDARTSEQFVIELLSRND